MDIHQLSNFCPIAKIPFLGKILEKVVTSQLQDHLESYPVLDGRESGFRPGGGMKTTLLCVREKLITTVNTGRPVTLEVLDLSVAFNTMDHATLLNHLQDRASLQGMVLDWFCPFLEERAKRMRLGPFLSDPHVLPCRVPQASALSPIIFKVYRAPFTELIHSQGVDFINYGEDTQLIFSLTDKVENREKKSP